MNVVKATWIAAFAQWNLSWIGIDEQRPAVLEVRDRDHADDAQHELNPAIA